MGKTGWMTVAFFAIAWAAAASSVAWVNKGQVEHRPAPAGNAAELAELRAAIDGLQRHNTQLTIRLEAYEDANASRVVIDRDSRCIDGTHFRTINGTMQNIGRC